MALTNFRVSDMHRAKKSSPAATPKKRGRKPKTVVPDSTPSVPVFENVVEPPSAEAEEIHTEPEADNNE